MSLASSSSLESLTSDQEDADCSPVSPLPAHSILRPIIGSGGTILRPTASGAFTSYVKRRGEPDGRTSVESSTATAGKVNKIRLY